MEEVNIEWPKRLANLVAEKNDGTRLLHVTHLNCHQPEGRAVSNMLQQDVSMLAVNYFSRVLATIFFFFDTMSFCTVCVLMLVLL